jgi:oligosaccharide repeat unit polymerase
MAVNPENLNQALFVAEHLRVWFSGNISGFCIWFDFADIGSGIKNSFHTFGGLAEWLGAPQRVVGVYEKAVDVNHQMEFSNVYTLFRFLIDDFGFIGSGFFIFILGFISRKLFLGIQNAKRSNAAALAGILCLLLFSFVSSIFAYNSILFSWILFTIFMFVTENIKKKPIAN